MSERIKKRKFLCIVDNSYFEYFCLFGSASDFQKNYPEEAA
jgi:hypothetical protein